MRAISEHEELAGEAGAERHLSYRGWLKLYRTDSAFAALTPEFELAARFGIANVPLDREGALGLEPALAGSSGTGCIGLARSASTIRSR